MGCRQDAMKFWCHHKCNCGGQNGCHSRISRPCGNNSRSGRYVPNTSHRWTQGFGNHWYVMISPTVPFESRNFIPIWNLFIFGYSVFLPIIVERAEIVDCRQQAIAVNEVVAREYFLFPLSVFVYLFTLAFRCVSHLVSQPIINCDQAARGCRIPTARDIFTWLRGQARYAMFLPFALHSLFLHFFFSSYQWLEMIVFAWIHTSGSSR